jgi:hypothetical protein
MRPLPEDRTGRISLFKSVGNTALCKVVRGHFHRYAITGEHSNSVTAHATGRVGNDFVIIDQFYAKCRVGQKFNDFALKFEKFFFSQNLFLCDANNGELCFAAYIGADFTDSSENLCCAVSD